MSVRYLRSFSTHSNVKENVSNLKKLLNLGYLFGNLFENYLAILTHRSTISMSTLKSIEVELYKTFRTQKSVFLENNTLF